MENKIIISDDALLDQVRAATGPTELCNAAGQLVGIVLPTEQFKQLKRDSGEVEFTPEYLAEIDRCVKEGRYKTTGQVLEMLARLDKALDGGA